MNDQLKLNAQQVKLMHAEEAQRLQNRIDRISSMQAEDEDLYSQLAYHKAQAAK